MLVAPVATDVASPWLPVLLLIAATVGTEEFQFTRVVISAVVPFEYFAVALNCCVKPSGRETEDGETEMEDSAWVTVSPVLAEIPELFAVMVAAPAARRDLRS